MPRQSVIVWDLETVPDLGGFAAVSMTNVWPSRSVSHCPIHPHMLRHACGFKLANDGVDTRALQHFLGHRNIIRCSRRKSPVPRPTAPSSLASGFWGGSIARGMGDKGKVDLDASRRLS
jgi:Phage integrase family